MKTYTLITGASSGMGACCAKLLSDSSNLIIASENLEALEQVKTECNQSNDILLWHCNFVTERENIMKSLEQLLTENDAVIDRYVHFAGLTKILPLKSFTIPYIDTIFNVNFFSILEIMRVLLKRINKKSLKNVVLISAMVSQRGDIGNSIYAASKGAINGLVYSLAQELAPEVRINALMPGAIMTPMVKNVSEEHILKLEKETPLGLGYAEDVVNYVDFLFSNKSRWITGQTIFVDGGRSSI